MQDFVDGVGDMSLMLFIWLVFISGLSMCACCSVGYRKLRAYRIVADTPTSRIRSAPQGYVEIIGHFKPLDGDTPVYAPFSEKPCVWYRAWVKRKRGDDDWETIFSEEDPRPCRLSDGTGDCLVVPSEAEMRVKTVSESWTPGDDSPTPLLYVDTDQFKSAVCFFEERIEIGPGYALGQFSTIDAGNEKAPAQSVNQMVEMLRRWRTDYMPDIEGRPDRYRPNPEQQDSWQEELVSEAAACWAEANGFPSEGQLHVLGPGNESRKPFIIGVGEEELIQKSLRTTWLCCSIGFIVFGAFWLALLLARMGMLF